MTTRVDMASPAFHYVYGEAEHHYLDPNTSEPQTPMGSPLGYDIPYGQHFSAQVYPSPEHDAESPETQATATPPAKTPTKRKRENRYKNAPPSVLSRRRAQNRASQRAYRERKDQRIKDLEQMLNEAKQRNETLSLAYAELHAEYVKLKAAQLQEATTAYQPFEPAIGLANNDRIDLDLFSGYSDLGSYSL